MLLFENPVLQRELLVNLRMKRAFVLLFVYVGLLGLVVFLSWPRPKGVSQESFLPEQGVTVDLTRPEAARQLVDLFFLGQYLLASLMAPSFAAGSITGEKESKTYEMLLASPLSPAAIVLGKLSASLCHLALLISASLPIVMLCLPLGGVSLYEVLAAYLALILSVIVYGMISIACSSYFKRTAAALVVSYLLILPPALTAILFWQLSSSAGAFRLTVTVTLLPILSLVICVGLFSNTCRRLLHPPDVGSGGKEVVDYDHEVRQAVGLVIQRDQFPDRLFAPSKRVDLLPDGANPVYDKEIRSEIFSQGTLMLRVVIQVSMFLAFPLMWYCLFGYPQYTSWYISYVVFFNLLVGPVFLAGAVSSERERQTLELLLTTTIPPRQFLWGKLFSGFRVSFVLTLFLFLPVILACLLAKEYWSLPAIAAVIGYLTVVLVVSITTSVTALFCSVIFYKTRTSMMSAYLVLLTLFMIPPAGTVLAKTFFSNHPLSAWLEAVTFTSPFAAVENIPLYLNLADWTPPPADIRVFHYHLTFYLLLNVVLFMTMSRMVKQHYRVGAAH